MVKLPIKFKIRIIIEPDEGGFHAYCPELKGLHVDGATREEALKNAKEAAQLYLNSLLKHGEPIPLVAPESEARKSDREFPARTSSKDSAKRTQTYVEELSCAS